MPGFQVPELASLGRVFRSTTPVELTEAETEYVVRCVKHIMDEHVVLDFTVSNTIEEQVCVRSVPSPSGQSHTILSHPVPSHPYATLSSLSLPSIPTLPHPTPPDTPVCGGNRVGRTRRDDGMQTTALPSHSIPSYSLLCHIPSQPIPSHAPSYTVSYPMLHRIPYPTLPNAALLHPTPPSPVPSHSIPFPSL